MSKFLDKLREDGEEVIEAAGNQAFMLDDTAFFFIVAEGRADIFAVPMAQGRAVGGRRFICSVMPGGLLVGSRDARPREGYAFLVSGAQGTRLARFNVRAFKSRSRSPEMAGDVAALIDSWVESLTMGFIGDQTPKLIEAILSLDREIQLNPGEHAKPVESVVWTSVTSGMAVFLDTSELLMPNEGCLLPISSSAWIRARKESVIALLSTRECLATDVVWSSLEAFQGMALRIIAARIRMEDERERFRLGSRQAAERARMNEAMARFSVLLKGDSLVSFSAQAPVFTVFGAVAHALGLPVKESAVPLFEATAEEQLQQMARNSGIRYRLVALQGVWWREDNGPLIGFFESYDTPVALLPCSSKRYRLWDSRSGQSIPVTKGLAAKLQPFGYMLYRKLPDHLVTWKELLAFARRGIEPDLCMVALMGVAGSLLTLFTPIVTSLLFNTVIPHAQAGQLWILGAALLLSAAGAAVFDFTKSIAMLRIEGRLDQHVQSAVWDRLLKLPPAFFKQFSSGDLATRSLGINAIRVTLSGTSVETLLASIFSISNLAFLFHYSVSLALAALAMASGASLVLIAMNLAQLRYLNKLAEISGRLASMELAFVTAITKLRISGSENRAFCRWASLFTEEKLVTRQVKAVVKLIVSFTDTLPLLMSMVIYAMIVTSLRSVSLPTGDFLAFNVAFNQFIAAFMLLSQRSVMFLGIVPHYRRIQPIFNAIPEVDEAKKPLEKLCGNVEVRHVSFRYDAHLPQVLHDLSISVRSGEFVAVVGPSGCGKSTLVRILLGFEQPETGAVFFDGKAMEGLDLRALRRQIGVVLQNGMLLAGDILSCIVGPTNLTVDDAWKAAEIAGLADDIRAMPMGMYTYVSEGGGNLSGGQRQRLLIARAIVSKPSLLIFDEATSALDNTTQANVNESLEKLRVTRIVVAHRLSTIVKADRIYVLDRGKIVQCGTYRELMAGYGPFAELARRQLA